MTVTLGDTTGHAEPHLASGRIVSMSELVGTGLRGLDREEAAIDALLHARVAEAIADPRPSVTAAEAFGAVRAGVAGNG